MVCKTKNKNKYGMKKLANPWLKHVASEKVKFPKKYKGKSIGEVAMMAKKTYVPIIKKKK